MHPDSPCFRRPRTPGRNGHAFRRRPGRIKPADRPPPAGSTPASAKPLPSARNAEAFHFAVRGSPRMEQEPSPLPSAGPSEIRPLPGKSDQIAVNRTKSDQIRSPARRSRHQQHRRRLLTASVTPPRLPANPGKSDQIKPPTDRADARGLQQPTATGTPPCRPSLSLVGSPSPDTTSPCLHPRPFRVICGKSAGRLSDQIAVNRTKSDLILSPARRSRHNQHRRRKALPPLRPFAPSSPFVAKTAGVHRTPPRPPT